MNQLTLDSSVLTVFVLVACLVCMWMVFFFGRQIQTTAYLRDSLIEGAKQQELKVLLRELHDKALEGPLDPQYPPPDGYGRTLYLWEPEKYAGNRFEEERYWEGETPEEKAERLEREEKRRQQRDAFRKWESEEKVRYEKLRQEAEIRALERAEKKIPSSIDISLLGGGWAFLLEFSTVIVIIFTLLILGIRGTLEGKDISPILAAIAGYVLGKATSGTKQQEKSASESTNVTAKK